METQKPLLKDKDGEEVDVHMYRSMIGSLMYLTSSRPDIMFAVCACARYQVNPKVSHLHAVKRIFRYLKGQPKLGLWYLKDSPFDLVAYTDSDYVGASLDRKSTIGGCQFLGCRLISWQCKKQTVVANSTTEAEYVAASSCCGQFWSTIITKTINGEEQLHALVDGKKIIITESSVRRDLQLADEEGGGPWCQETMGDTIAQTRFESVSKHSNDSLLARGNTLRSDEDRLKLDELMALCTTLQNWVLDLEKTKTTQYNEIASLKRRLKKFEKKDKLRTHRLKRLHKGRIDAIDADEEITLVSVHDVNVSAGEEVFATTVDDITLAQVLEEMKSTKPKKKGVVIQELGESTTTISSQLSSQQSQDKGKGVFIEPVKPMKNKDLIRLDE
ncbi:hypothetical protein Tco_0019209 [Tanacetum coccineum]